MQLSHPVPEYDPVRGRVSRIASLLVYLATLNCQILGRATALAIAQGLDTIMTALTPEQMKLKYNYKGKVLKYPYL